LLRCICKLLGGSFDSINLPIINFSNFLLQLRFSEGYCLVSRRDYCLDMSGKGYFQKVIQNPTSINVAKTACFSKTTCTYFLLAALSTKTQLIKEDIFREETHYRLAFCKVLLVKNFSTISSSKF